MINVLKSVYYSLMLCVRCILSFKEVVLEIAKIRNCYLKTWFIPDLLAVLPVDHIILIIKVSAKNVFINS